MNIVNNDIIKKYIDNEINYIKKEIDLYKYKYNNNYSTNDLDKDYKRLENISEKDIQEIVNNVNEDEELIETINETIHYYLYHQKEV